MTTEHNGKKQAEAGPGNSEERRLSVKALLMTPLMAGMTALLLLIGAGLYAQYIHYYNRQLMASRSSSLKLYHASVRDHYTVMGSLLEVIAADSRLFPLFESRNAEAMENLYHVTFERLRRDFRIASLVFIDPLKFVIADLDHPENRNAIVNRFVFAEAENSGAAVIGLDVGTSGGLTMRMVRPIFRHGVLIGYIEAAIDFSDVVRSMSGPQNADLVFALNKSAITEELLPKGQAAQEAPGLWTDAGDGVLIYSSAKSLGKDLLLALLQKNREGAPGNDRYLTLLLGQEYYVAGVFPLTDSLGSSLGDLLIVEKATSLWREYLVTAMLLLSLGLTIIFVCRRLVAGKLARTDARFADMMDKISERDAMFENVFTESETGFVLQNWVTGKILRANRVALSIFDVAEPSQIDLAEMRPLAADDAVLAGWQASGTYSPLMSVVTGKGVTYCELTQFFLGGNEEIQCVAIRDVTRVVALQNENREQIKYLQDVIDQLPGIVFIKDSDCRLVMYNAVFDQLFGDGQNMVGKVRFADWMDDAMDDILARERATIASGQPVTFEHSFSLRDGQEHTFLASQKIIAGIGGGEDLLCVSTDITERSLMEKQLINLRLKAEEASQAKSQFLARMSHEIRTPMNVILGMSHLGLAAQPNDQQRNYLTKIHGAARNLLGIINDILDFSKIEAGEMTLETIPFSLNDLLFDIEAGVQTLVADKPVEFLLSLPGIPGELMGDPLRIRQVLLNLVNNAIKFTNAGQVRLACHVREERGQEYLLEFSVTDTGIGIPEEAMHRLFTSFQQVDGSTTRKYGGTGLGLVISQQFVRLMGGDITVSSVVGQGSTFAFTLTLGKAAGAPKVSVAPGPDARHDEQPAGAGKGEASAADRLPESASILVVEDNTINQEIILELLERDHWRILAVDNGLEAVRAVEKQSFDLVFMDLQMPVMDGLNATRAIRALASPGAATVPIIALTANAMNEDRERCLEAGMNDFLSKPIDVDDLEAKLQLWLTPARG